MDNRNRMFSITLKGNQQSQTCNRDTEICPAVSNECSTVFYSIFNYSQLQSQKYPFLICEYIFYK